jgi:DNA-binding transcriptional regulator of glucitol operon
MRKLWTPRWLLVHAAALILVVGFLLLGWWQVTRAASGNLISFGYAIEWPAFAAFVIYVWVKEVRQAVRGVAPASGGQASGGTHVEPATDGVADRGTDAPVPRRRPRPRNEAAYDDSGDTELAAYNRYLAWLNAHPHASPSEYPG